MKTSEAGRRVAVVALLVLAACRNNPPTPAPPPPLGQVPSPADATPMTCLATLSIDQGSSVLNEQRAAGPPAFDFFERYPAADVDPTAQVPVAAVAEFQMGKTPLLWFTPDKRGVVVNAAVLSDLVVADVTRMRPGESARVGQLTELGQGKLADRDLVTFLIRARAIATYVHIGAELCLVAETTTAGTYTARFTGSHTYFTSGKHVEPLAFEVSIDPSGVITARATP